MALRDEIFKNHGAENSRTQPPVCLSQVTHRLTEEVANLIQRNGWLYKFRDKFVSFNEFNGDHVEIGPYAFCDWFPQHAWVYRETKNQEGMVDQMEASISDKMARQILGSYQLMTKIHAIDSVLHTRLPVMNEKGEFELLHHGYNLEHRTMVLKDCVDYPLDVPLKDAVQGFRTLVEDFPLQDERSFLVWMCLMLTNYLYHSFPESTSFPITILNANLPGSGKSLIAKIGLIASHGTCDSVKLTDGETFAKELDAVAKTRRPYLFLDDISGIINNNYLNAFVTSPRWAFRVMYSQDQLAVPLKCHTIITGNNLRCSQDIERRALWCNFHASLDAKKRAAERQAEELSAGWVTTHENRARILSWLWAIVREWQVKKPETHRKLPGFEEFSETVASMVEFAFEGNPLETPEMINAGDTYEQEWLGLMCAAVDFMRKRGLREGQTPDPIQTPHGVRYLSYEFSIPDLIGVSRRFNVFTDLLQDVDTCVQVMKNAKNLAPSEQGEGELSNEDLREQAWSYTTAPMSKAFGIRLTSQIDRVFTYTDAETEEKTEFKFYKKKRSAIYYTIETLPA